jgi:hypothetical protein
MHVTPVDIVNIAVDIDTFVSFGVIYQLTFSLVQALHIRGAHVVALCVYSLGLL